MQKSQKDSMEMKTRRGLRSARIISVILLCLGVAIFITSVFHVSSVLALAGLSLIFWGTLLLYIQPQEYVKKALLDAIALSSLTVLNQMTQELGYKGKAVYLPPKYFEESGVDKVYIPRRKDGKLPTPESLIRHTNQIFAANPDGILLTPPGAEMTRLFEEILATPFIKTNLEYLQRNLPRLLIEELEIAEDFEMNTEVSETRVENPKIHVKVVNSLFQDVWNEKRNVGHICVEIGCPILSAIACSLAKATGKPIIIERVQTQEEGKVLDAVFVVLEATEFQDQTAEIPEPFEVDTDHGRHRANIPGLFLIALGSMILAWMGWVMWYDITTWGKNLFIVFFGSRTGQALSLGIGMRVFHYFLAGLVLLAIGLITFFRKTRDFG